MSRLCEARVAIVTGARRGGLLDRANDLAGGRCIFSRPVNSGADVVDDHLGAVRRRAFSLDVRAYDKAHVAELERPASHGPATFTVAGVPSAMLFVCNANGSHDPREAMEIDDFLQAAAVLTQSLATEATATVT
jgi:hypothetical protein